LKASALDRCSSFLIAGDEVHAEMEEEAARASNFPNVDAWHYLEVAGEDRDTEYPSFHIYHWKIDGGGRRWLRAHNSLAEEAVHQRWCDVVVVPYPSYRGCCCVLLDRLWLHVVGVAKEKDELLHMAHLLWYCQP
jgi:hypothetical protein